MKKNIDMVGKPCPIPVIEAKKAMKEMKEGELLEIIVDNEIACENLEKMAKGLGHSIGYQAKEDGNYGVTITVGKGVTVEKSQGISVVAIGKNTMGEGSDELGKMLMKSYIYALTELESLPDHILFFNGGIHLVCRGADTLEDLQTLVNKGVQISACGACLNYYEKTEELALGQISNMFEIASTMAKATKLVNL
ncbi:MAG: sulfurtransferase-like selenium metabolism protein YedF [Clostridiales bacterium]|nr:sulfurtransferase-like selenium metabolism protein YedF [Clostridiales bacterium]